MRLVMPPEPMLWFWSLTWLLSSPLQKMSMRPFEPWPTSCGAARNARTADQPETAFQPTYLWSQRQPSRPPVPFQLSPPSPLPALLSHPGGFPTAEFSYNKLERHQNTILRARQAARDRNLHPGPGIRLDLTRRDARQQVEPKVGSGGSWRQGTT